jgi:6-phosphogluconolactonase
MNTRLPLRLILGLLAHLATAAATAPAKTWVYFGTFTGGHSQGIHVAGWNAVQGELSAPRLAAALPHPSYLAVHPSQALLYAVSQRNPGRDVQAFRIAGDGSLDFLGAQATGGDGPLHLTTDPAGREVLVASYYRSAVTVLPLDATGALGSATAVITQTGSSVHPERQTQAHAHAVQVHPSGRFALVSDLGADCVWIYRRDADTGALADSAPDTLRLPAGAGPRHLVFNRAGRTAYLVNELHCTVAVLNFEAETGRLQVDQILSTLPSGVAPTAEMTVAAVQLHPTGRFLYVSTRGHDSLTVYAVDPANGRLEWVENVPSRVATPRAFGIEPGGRFMLVAGQRSHRVEIFGIGPDGRLTATGRGVEVGSPVCVVFATPPSGGGKSTR